jgi:hypothetical protein
MPRKDDACAGFNTQASVFVKQLMLVVRSVEGLNLP